MTKLVGKKVYLPEDMVNHVLKVTKENKQSFSEYVRVVINQQEIQPANLSPDFLEEHTASIEKLAHMIQRYIHKLIERDIYLDFFDDLTTIQLQLEELMQGEAELLRQISMK